MIGAAIVRNLQAQERTSLVLKERDELNLADQAAVNAFFKSEHVSHVFLDTSEYSDPTRSAMDPATGMYQGLMAQTNVIQAAHRYGVQNLLFVGSNTVYSNQSLQPSQDAELFGRALDFQQEQTAIAKMAGIKLSESYNREFGRNYRSLVPASLYGPGGEADAEDCHSILGLMRQFHEAVSRGDKEVSINGAVDDVVQPLHVDDLASASVFVLGLDREKLENDMEPMQSHLSVGPGNTCTLGDLASAIAQVTSFNGKIVFEGKQNGKQAPNLLDPSKLSELGWSASLSLIEGLEHTFSWFVQHQNKSSSA